VRSDAEELHKGVAVGEADLHTLLLAALEDHDGGDAPDAVFSCHLGGVVDVELADLDLAGIFVGELFDDGSELLAGAAPGGGEVDQDGGIRLEDLGFEVLIAKVMDVRGSHRAHLLGLPVERTAGFFFLPAFRITVRNSALYTSGRNQACHVNP
jgi:hypothetical protein